MITVGKAGPGDGTLQHFPNISSIRTDSTAPEMSPAPFTGLKFELLLKLEQSFHGKKEF